MLSEIVFRYLLAGYSHYPDSIRPALAKKYFNSPAAALLADTSISYKAIMPLDIQPIVTSPDYYLITILDWVIIHNKDTIPIPLPKEFNRNMRSIIMYYQKNSRTHINLLSGPVRIYDFVISNKIRELDYLHWRLFNYHVSDVFPVDAYYCGISKYPQDTVFWNYIHTRYGTPSDSLEYYVARFDNGRSSHASSCIVRAKKEVNCNYQICIKDLSIIYFDAGWEEVPAPPAPPRTSSTNQPPAPPPMEIEYWKEVVIPLPISPEYSWDVAKRVTRLEDQAKYRDRSLLDFVQFSFYGIPVLVR